MKPEKQLRPTHGSFLDVTGHRYGKLEVIDYWCRDGKFHHRWLCRCDCGNETLARGNNLRTGNTISCGCEHAGGRATERHGMHDSKEYSSWEHMISRCASTSGKSYRLYGARGISVCEEWRSSFAKFYEDMGPVPSATHSIDRINSDLGYFKENCRWATPTQQARNVRHVTMVEFNGENITLNDLAELHGRTPAAVKSMMRRGRTLRQALLLDAL